MSTQTEHLGLHQWEAGDPFLRSDFNEDFAKLDAAMGALQAWAALSCVTGSYTVESTEEFTIELGFRPKAAIFIAYASSDKLVVMIDDLAVRVENSSLGFGQATDFKFTDTGIILRANGHLTKQVGAKVRYIAFQ